MAITGVHNLVYTSEPAAVRAVFRDVFGWRHVDDGDGWLIFATPPAEIGVHPDEGHDGVHAGLHQISLMCDDLEETIRALRARGLEVRGDPFDAGFGILTTLVLPGGLEMMLYEPRHESPLD